MTIRSASLASLALLAMGGAAAARVPAIFKPPSTSAPSSVATPQQAGAVQAPQTPLNGIPGYYDPATRTFTPLQMAQPQGTGEIGDLRLVVAFIFNNGKPTAGTINTILNNNYGAYGSNPQSASSTAASSFVIQQYTSTSASFPTTGKTSSQTVSAPFTTAYPLFQSRINCAYSNATASYSSSVFVAQQAPKSGTTTLKANCYL